MKRKFPFPAYVHYAVYIISSALFAYFINISMIDDGLRHIAFAVNTETMKSWGEVFPHSLFSNFDPWLNWHNLLRVLLIFVSYENLHIAVNLLTLLALMLLVHKYLKQYINYDFGSLAYVIVFIIVYLTSYRYLMVRPDQLSGLFVFAALLLPNRFWLTFWLTVIYGPFYYLFFIYTGSIGLVYMVQGRWKAFAGAFTGSVLVLLYFLITDLNGYISTVKYILTDQSLRMGLEVTEGQPLLNIFTNINYYLLLGIFFTLSSFLIYKKYNFFKQNTLALFLVITSVLWINQYRYFQLFSPFIAILILWAVLKIDIKTMQYSFRKYFLTAKRLVNYSKNKLVFSLVIIPFMVFFFTYELNLKYKPLSNELLDYQFYKNSEYDNKRILMNRMTIDIYTSLYFNPTIKIIPSCSIGWFEDKNKKMKDIYIRIQKENGINEKELSMLIEYTNADIYIHYMKNAKQELNFKKLEHYGIIPFKIFQNRIIFKIKKSVK
jgi:hypothetical protein